jgi:type VI protein secretion system component Hcp
MRSLLALVLPPLAAAAVVSFAPSARADGFFVTFTGGVNMPRTAGAAFDSTSQAPIQYSFGTGQAKVVTPVHIEVDDWTTMPTVITALSSNAVFDVTVDFTKPNAQGVETTYLTAKYARASLTRLRGSYTAGATSTVVETIEFAADDIQYATPATPSAPPPTTAAVGLKPGMPPLVRLPIAPPTLSRTMIVRVAGSAAVTSATLKASTNPATNSAVTQVSFEVQAPRDAIGRAAARVLLDTKTQKSPDAATAALSTAMSSNQSLNPVTIDFIAHQPAGDATVYSMDLNNARVKSDQLDVSSGKSVETVLFTEQHIQITSRLTSSTGRL